MGRIFTISSSGATATMWLVSNLNKHREILAFHAIREDPVRNEKMNPEQLFLMLENLLSDAKGKAVVGSVHTFSGQKPREVFLQNGGSFMVMIRDPICRINSLFLHHYRQEPECSRSQIQNFSYEFAVANNQLSDLETEFLMFRPQIGPLTKVETLFSNILLGIMSADVSTYLAGNENEIIKFEDMVSSEEYCFDKISAITGIDDQEMRQIVADNLSKKINVHSEKKHMSAYIFDNWPEQFRRLFVLAMCGSCGIETCLRAYKHYGYTETATVLESYISKTKAKASVNVGFAFKGKGNVATSMTFGELLSKCNDLESHWKFDEAITCYKEWLSSPASESQFHFVAFFNLGNLLIQVGEIDKAITAFQESLKLKPDFSQASTRLYCVLNRWSYL